MNIQIINNTLKFDNELDLTKCFSLLANQYTKKEVSCYRDDLRYDYVKELNYKNAKQYGKNFTEIIKDIECKSEFKTFGKKTVNTYFKEHITYSYDEMTFNCNEIYSDYDLLSIIFLDKKIDLKYIKDNLLKNKLTK